MQCVKPSQRVSLCLSCVLCHTTQPSLPFPQVVLQHVGHQSRRQGRRHRITSATLCSVLLAFAVACPAAATPDLLSRMWSSWAAWLLPSTTPAQAAAVAWAVGRLQVQPSQALAQGLLQQVAVAAADTQLQHVAAVLLQVREGAWQVQRQQVQTLLATILQRQAAELAAAGVFVGDAETQHQLQRAWSGQRLAGCMCGGRANNSQGIPLLHAPSSTAAACLCGGGGSSSASASSSYGLANHRLKGWLTAAAAAAAWSDALSPQQLQSAVQMNSAVCASSGLLALTTSAEQQLQAHLQALTTASGGRRRLRLSSASLQVVLDGSSCDAVSSTAGISVRAVKAAGGDPPAVPSCTTSGSNVCQPHEAALTV